MKLIIAGSRAIRDIEVAYGALAESPFQLADITEVVSGCCRGVDALGERIARQVGIPIKRFPAEWSKYGISAGPRRNQQMADYCKPGDGLLAIPYGESRGTYDMIDKARRRGLRVYVAHLNAPFIQTTSSEVAP